MIKKHIKKPLQICVHGTMGLTLKDDNTANTGMGQLKW